MTTVMDYRCFFCDSREQDHECWYTADVLDMRSEQARIVMPLIGPLLDAVEACPRDAWAYLCAASPEIEHLIWGIEMGMEAGHD